MLKESIIEMQGKVHEHKFFDQNTILHEYETIITNLKEELNNCKLEQNKIHLEIEILQKENKNANDKIHHILTECNHEKCDDIYNQETVTNLEKRITILQMEKDSVFQLWQMSLKAIDALEEELKTVHKEDKSTRFYQEQINNIKETYSEAIIALESKLIAAKENFFQQQTVWEKSKERIDQLTKEKNDIIQELNIFQQQSLEKEKYFQSTVESLKENLIEAKLELKEIKQSKINLEEKLKKMQQFATTMTLKDSEAKNKVSEAVYLIESAVKEKESILRREAQVVEEKMKLESCLSKLSEEYTSRLETEIQKAKETYNKNIKKYLLEIKELKVELREQSMLLDRSQRDYRLAEQELEKYKQGSNDFYLKSNMQISTLQKNLHTNEEIHNTVYDNRIQYLENKISNLQEKLSNSSEKLRCLQLQNSRDTEDNAKEANYRTREIMEKCLNFERQLSRALIDKEYLTNNLHSLELSFEQEIKRRNHEKVLLESKVKDLQEKILYSEKILSNTKVLSDSTLHRKDIGQQTLINFDSLTNILSLQQKFDKKTKELTEHVEIHQKLSNKWKEEANLLTCKFQKRTEEFRIKISALQKQNEELSRELLFYQQLLARCNTQLVQNYSTDMETR